MSLVKSFFIGLVTFLGLNLVFFLIYYGLTGTLVQQFGLMTQFYHIIFEFLAFPVFNAFEGLIPSSAILSFVSIPASTTPIADIVLYLGMLIPPIVASLIAGRMAEDKLKAFLSWMMISLVLSVLGFFGYLFAYINNVIALGVGITYIFLLGAVFTIFYGFFALAANKSEFY